jgi:hypothetical protein
LSIVACHARPFRKETGSNQATRLILIKCLKEDQPCSKEDQPSTDGSAGLALDWLLIDGQGRLAARQPAGGRKVRLGGWPTDGR